MRAVKSGGTSPEIAVRKALHRAGFRFRLHVSALPGKPDVVLARHRTVIFVHGCFWHGHKCKRGSRQPKKNAGYWREKISRNKARDKKNAAELRKLGWRVITIWECGIKSFNPATVLRT